MSRALKKRYGRAAASWKPSRSEIWEWRVANGKPLVVTKVGRKYTVRVMGRPLVLSATGGITVEGRPGWASDAKIADFKSKDDAMRIAHKIGRYILGLGDFVDTYTDYR